MNRRVRDGMHKFCLKLSGWLERTRHGSSLMPGRSCARKGTVLILVLWVLAMLTVLGGYHAVESRIRRNLGQEAWNELQGREAAYSLLRFSALKLARSGAGRTDDMEPDSGLDGGDEELRLDADGTEYSVRFGDLELEFSLRDESGKLSINKASQAQLEELFAGLLGEDAEERAAVIAQSIMDWRDADNISRDDGAEDSWYSDLVPPYHAADRPFLLLDELLLVRGIDMSLYYGPLEWRDSESDDPEDSEPAWRGSLRDLLTVYNDSSGVSRAYAAAPVKAVMEGSTAGASRKTRTICLTFMHEGTLYAVYWSRQVNGRFSVIHWTEQAMPGAEDR